MLPLPGVNSDICWGIVCPDAQAYASIDLSGPKGQRFNYLTMDDKDHYLLSAHLGPGILYIIDLETNKLVKAIPGGRASLGSNSFPSFARFTHLIGARKESALWTCKP